MNGVHFGNLHSYENFNLILAPFIPTPAVPKTNYVEIAGGNGSLDFTEAYGEVKYKDREFKFTFTVDQSDTMNFDEKVTQVSNALNGKACKITLDRDSDYYWDGRCFVNEYLQDKKIKQIVISATVKPYKLKQNETVFTANLTGNGQEIILLNDRKSVVPVIICSGDAVIEFAGTTHTLTAGTHKVLDILLKEGENVLNISGNGTITFRYQEGAL